MIDGGLFLGRNPSTGLSLEPENLIRRLNEQGISTAIVSSYKSLFFDSREGNDDVLDLAEEFPDRILPAIMMNAFNYDVMADANYFRDMRQQGARVFSILLSPVYYDIHLDSRLLRHMAHEAAKAGLVVQLGIRNPTDFRIALDFYSDMKAPVLIRWMTGRNYDYLGEMILAIKHTDHFYFDVGSLLNPGGIKLLIERGGADRLYYCSNQPEALPYSSLALFEAAKISEGDREKIGHRNLEKIFGLTSTPTIPLPQAWKNRWKEILKYPKIDTHFHIDGWNLMEPEHDPVFFQEYFDHYGYEKIVISSIRGLNDDIVRANEETAKLIASKEGHYGLITLDPNRTELSIQQLKMHGKNKKFVGLKTIQDAYKLPLNADSYVKIFKANVASFKLPVMAHIPGMLEAAKQFPKLNFICAHSTWGRVGHFAKQKNIFFDIATSHHDAHETRLDQLMKAAGEDRILYACDAQLLHPAWTMGKIASYSFAPATLKKIFQTNAQKAFPRLK